MLIKRRLGIITQLAYILEYELQVFLRIVSSEKNNADAWNFEYSNLIVSVSVCLCMCTRQLFSN